MNRKELIEKLLDADKEIYMMYPNKQRIDVVIGGGTSLVIRGLLLKQTIDIDTLGKCDQFEHVFNKYNINCRMNTFIDSIPKRYDERLIKIELNTKIINYFSISLEDLIVMKLYSNRNKDYKDITDPNVIKNVNWNVLDKIIEDGEADLSFNVKRYHDFLKKYKEYKEKYKKI